MVKRSGRVPVRGGQREEAGPLPTGQTRDGWKDIGEKSRGTLGSVWGQRIPGSSERKIGTRRKGRDRAPVGVKELQLYRTPTSKGKWEI